MASQILSCIKISSVQSAVSVSKKMVVVTICSAITVNTISVGCVLEIGSPTAPSITSAPDIRKIPILLTSQHTHKLERL